MRLAVSGIAPLALIVAAPASALTLVSNTGWIGDNILVASGPSAGSPILFTVAQQSTLRLTDCCIVGDTYRLFQNGNLIATSTLFAGAPLPQYGGDSFYEPFWESASYSKFAYTVGPGSYSFIITGDGGGGVPSSFGLRLDTIAAVPEATSWALMIGGFGLLGGAMRRRRANVVVSYA